MNIIIGHKHESPTGKPQTDELLKDHHTKLLAAIARYEKLYPSNMFKHPPEVAALTGGLFNGVTAGSK